MNVKFEGNRVTWDLYKPHVSNDYASVEVDVGVIINCEIFNVDNIEVKGSLRNATILHIYYPEKTIVIYYTKPKEKELSKMITLSLIGYGENDLSFHSSTYLCHYRYHNGVGNVTCIEIKKDGETKKFHVKQSVKEITDLLGGNEQ